MSEISDARDEEKGLPGRLFPLLATLMAGGILGALGAQPFTMLADGAKASVMLVREQFQERPHILGPLVYEGSGLVSSDKDAMEPGYTLVQGIFADGTQVRPIPKVADAAENPALLDEAFALFAQLRARERRAA